MLSGFLQAFLHLIQDTAGWYPLISYLILFSANKDLIKLN